jgi:ubiquitin C-terminal hydrolase
MEFNIFFLDALHEDTNLYIKKEKDPNQPKNPNNKAIYNKDSFNNWLKFVNYHNKSIIVDLFFGNIKYTYTCSICGNKTCVFEIYTVLALPLSDSIKEYNKKIDGKIQIDQCFKYYFNKEKNDTNLYYCSICKKDVKRDSKISIVTAPPYLIINLIRTFNRTKNFNFIDYPIYDFDASKYVENNGGKYDLIGIVNHYGDYGSLGHFTAYCKKNEKWYEFDDAGVHDIDENNIKSNNSYILFYKRQNVSEEIDFEKLYEKYRNNNM